MTIQHHDRCQRLRIPDPNHLVNTRCSNQSVLIVEVHINDLGGVAAEGAEKAAIEGTPDLDEVVIRTLLE